MSANPIGQVPAMLGPNSKKTKITATTTVLNITIQKFEVTSYIQGWIYKISKYKKKKHETTESNIQKHLKQ
jgi:hypothetical protein